MNYKLTKEERETIIRYDESCSECLIYTCSKPLMKKLDHFCEIYPDSYKLIAEDSCSKTYTTTKDRITIRSGIKKVLTENQKSAARDRLKKHHSKK